MLGEPNPREPNPTVDRIRVSVRVKVRGKVRDMVKVSVRVNSDINVNDNIIVKQLYSNKAIIC